MRRSKGAVHCRVAGSMEPAFQRGDILVLDNNARNVDVGDIVVFKVTGRDIPIVHRVIRCHDTIATGYSAITNANVSKKAKKSSGETNPWGWEDDDGLEILTKGDNNELDDRSLYAPGQRWLKRSEIVGKARASLPYVGMVTIYLNDYPMLKYVLIGLMGLFVLTTREG
jgi:signal peptidase